MSKNILKHNQTHPTKYGSINHLVLIKSSNLAISIPMVPVLEPLSSLYTQCLYDLTKPAQT